MKKFTIACIMIVIGFILFAGCTGCVKNECKKMIKPTIMNKYTLTVIDDQGVAYTAKDEYVFNALALNESKMVTYIDGTTKLIVTVY